MKAETMHLKKILAIAGLSFTVLAGCVTSSSQGSIQVSQTLHRFSVEQGLSDGNSWKLFLDGSYVGETGAPTSRERLNGGAKYFYDPVSSKIGPVRLIYTMRPTLTGNPFSWEIYVNESYAGTLVGGV